MLVNIGVYLKNGDVRWFGAVDVDSVSASIDRVDTRMEAKEPLVYFNQKGEGLLIDVLSIAAIEFKIPAGDNLTTMQAEAQYDALATYLEAEDIDAPNENEFVIGRSYRLQDHPFIEYPPVIEGKVTHLNYWGSVRFVTRDGNHWNFTRTKLWNAIKRGEITIIEL